MANINMKKKIEINVGLSNLFLLLLDLNISRLNQFYKLLVHF